MKRLTAWWRRRRLVRAIGLAAIEAHRAQATYLDTATDTNFRRPAELELRYQVANANLVALITCLRSEENDD